MSIYLGTTPLANTGYDKANTDLSNLTNTGKNIANWSNNVTNCITEIPQDIKLELNNGTLTLKAGSKVYVPNGSGVFDEVIITSDMQITPTGYASSPHMLCVLPNNTIQLLSERVQQYSGNTAPSGQPFMFWYDTANNYVKYTTDSGSTWQSGWCLPLAIATITNGTGVTSIDQVFNGFGYIGSTVFALPGVKGLIPNGRNTDGTLKNIEFTTSNVLTYTYTGSWANTWVLQLSSAGIGIVSASNYIESDNEPTNTSGWTVWHNTKDNINYLKNIGAEGASWERQDLCNDVAKFITDSSSKITSFTSKTAFHALDYNDSSTISGWAMPSSRYIELTAGASGVQYTAPANGWFIFDFGYSGVGYSRIDYEEGYWQAFNGTNQQNNAWTIPIKKGKKITVTYSGCSMSVCKFVYAEGEN